MNDKTTIGILVITGIILSFGQLLLSPDQITVRIAVGRAIIAGGLGAAAGAFLAVFPDLPTSALVGIACVLVSLGTSALEKLLGRLTNAGNSGGWYLDPYEKSGASSDLDDEIERNNKDRP